MLEQLRSCGAKVHPDIILETLRQFHLEPRPGKLSAVIGEVRTPAGEVFVPEAVRQAYTRVALEPVSYIGTSGENQWLGDPDFLTGTARLVLGGTEADRLIATGRLVAAGTPGGTGAISLFATALARSAERPQMVIGKPTWGNHDLIWRFKGIEAIRFRHMTANRYDMTAQVEALSKAPADTVVFYHAGKSHNPTGVNPHTPDDWRFLASRTNGRLVFFDTPYAGLVDGLGEDTGCVRTFHEAGVPVAFAVSFSKNAGLYNLRVGALFVVAPDPESALSIQKLINDCARIEYSSPPATGERIMAHILNDRALMASWQSELAEVAVDIKSRRRHLTTQLPEFGFLAEQAGIFSLLPLTLGQIDRLRETYGAYILPSGRICVGSLTPAEIPRFAEAVREVL